MALANSRATERFRVSNEYPQTVTLHALKCLSFNQRRLGRAPLQKVAPPPSVRLRGTDISVCPRQGLTRQTAKFDEVNACDVASGASGLTHSLWPILCPTFLFSNFINLFYMLTFTVELKFIIAVLLYRLGYSLFG